MFWFILRINLVVSLYDSGHANFENSSEGGSLKQGASPEVPRIAVDKSIEFSYDELAKASDNFSTAYKIGQGGFASVYYGELRGEVRHIILVKIEMISNYSDTQIDHRPSSSCFIMSPFT